MLPVILNENGTNGKITAEVRICSNRSPVAWHLTDRLWQTLRVPKLITLMTNGVLAFIDFPGKAQIDLFYQVHVAKNLTLEVNICGTFRH